MGYKLVTKFSENSRNKLRSLMRTIGAEDANKIPYHRGCDRIEANRILRHHITLIDWSSRDASCADYLRRLDDFHFPSGAHIEVQVQEVGLRPVEHDALMLYLKIEPTKEYKALTDQVEEVLGVRTTRSPRITLAISKDHDKIKRFYQKLCSRVELPFELTVSGVELYQRWSPVKKLREFQ